MLKNKILFVLAFMVIGCSQEKKTSLLINSKISSAQNISLIRSLASGNKNQCMYDIFNVETLKKEIAELEKEFDGEKTVGQWKHIDLSTLASAQGNFLKTYGDKLGDLKDSASIDYSSCTDVPCIFNRIYQKDNSVAGYVHYLWYLKFGHLLSADNQLPYNANDQSAFRFKDPGKFNNKSHELSAYLYNDDELYGLWRLSHTLKAPFTTLTNLKEIQRLPRGEKFGYPYGDSACGIAHNFGYIIMSDECLKLDEEDGNKDQGFLYTAITHELSHMIDYDEGASVYAASYRSAQSDFLSIAGFTKSESRVDGRVQTLWIPDPGIKFIRSYAKTNPMENFAELLAHFRHDGTLSEFKLGPELNTFASKNYFNERNYTLAAQSERWVKKYSQKFSRDILEISFDCEESPKKEECIELRVTELDQRIRSTIKISEADGCIVLSRDATFKPKLKDSIELKLAEWSKYSSSRTFLGKLKVHHDALGDKRYAYESYIECLNSESARTCFEETLKVKYGSLLEDLAFTPEESIELTNAYLSSHSFADIKEEASKFYRTNVRSFYHLLKQEVATGWRNCSILPLDDSAPPEAGPFLISDGYMVSSLYNCINDRFPGMVNNSMDALMKKGVEAGSSGEKEYLKDIVRSEVLKLLSEKFYTESVNEKKQAENFIKVENGRVRKNLLTYRYWANDVRGKDRIQAACRAQALKVIGMSSTYHLKKDLYGEFIERVACFNIHTEL